jgi:Ca2+-binding RTX toxin-like protein
LDTRPGSIGDKVDLSALGNATHLPAYDPSWAGNQAVFTYNAATDVTTLSYYEQGSSTPVFQLKFTGNVHYDIDVFFNGIDPSPIPTEGDDAVFGNEGNETFNLFGGDDLYQAFGGGGDKFIAGGNGNDSIISGSGNDNLSGGSGADGIDGYFGNDSIRGNAGNDHLAGGFGTDTLYGGDGDDVLNGDVVDFFHIEGGFTGNDRIYGGPGYDTVDVTDQGGSFSEYSITKNADGSVTLTDITPIDPEGDAFDYGTDTLISVEAILFEDGIYVVATNTFTPFDSII